MDIEDRIRSRIEAVLINDARNHAEMVREAGEGEPLEADPFSEERNLYQRMIASYRSAVKEVNTLLETNVGFLSGFYQFIDNIKDKSDFEEICGQIVDCVLQDLGAEYCTLLFFENQSEAEQLCLEGVRESPKFLRIHSKPELLGSGELEQALIELSSGTAEAINVSDVYREPQLVRVDFPSMVRSLVSIPVTAGGEAIGLLIMSHSQPRYFNDNHIRVLKILAGFVSHLKLLTGRRMPHSRPVESRTQCHGDTLSVILLDFEIGEAGGRRPAHKQTVCQIRSRLLESLEGKGSILFHGDRDLLVLLPGVSPEEVHATVSALRKAFRSWRSDHSGQLQSIRMNLGYATCEGDDDFDRALQVALHLMHPDMEEEERDLAAHNS